MINLNTYISEKLKIDKSTKISDDLDNADIISLKSIIDSVKIGKKTQTRTSSLQVFHELMSMKMRDRKTTNREGMIILLNNYTKNLPEVIGDDDPEKWDSELYGFITSDEEIEWK